MKKLIIVILMILLTSALIFTGCAKPAPAPSPAPAPAPSPAPAPAPSPAPAPAPSEVIELKYSSPYLEIEPPSLVGLFFCDQVEERSGGKVKIKRFPAGVLAKDIEHLNLVKSGSVDLVSIIAEMFPMEIPLAAIVGLQNYPVDQTLRNLYELQFVRPDTAPLFAEEQTKNNIKFLCQMALGEFGIMLKEPASNLDGLSGRTIASVRDEPDLKELGMHVKTIGVPDMYEALSRGTVDGLWMALSPMVMLKWHEVGKMYLSSYMNNANLPLMINLETWNSLPPDLQQIFLDSAMAAQEFSLPMTKEVTAGTLQAFKDAGLELGTLTPEEQARWYKMKFEYTMADYLNFAEKAGVAEQAKIIDKAWREILFGE